MSLTRAEDERSIWDRTVQPPGHTHQLNARLNHPLDQCVVHEIKQPESRERHVQGCAILLISHNIDMEPPVGLRGEERLSLKHMSS
jgi:hypothetical protein